MSWSASGLAMPKELKELPAVLIGNDGLFNFQCFLNLIKKYGSGAKINFYYYPNL